MPGGLGYSRYYMAHVVASLSSTAPSLSTTQATQAIGFVYAPGGSLVLPHRVPLFLTPHDWMIAFVFRYLVGFVNASYRELPIRLEFYLRRLQERNGRVRNAAAECRNNCQLNRRVTSPLASVIFSSGRRFGCMTPFRILGP